MRELLRLLFGDMGNNVTIINRDGREWVQVRAICDLMGIGSEYSAVGDRSTMPELNLTEEEKQRIHVRELHPTLTLWFVSATGLVKIVARSRSEWAGRFRTRLLMERVQRIM